MRKKPIALLISCFDWYEKRLKYIGEYLEKEGYSVNYMFSNFDHLKKQFTNEFEHVKGFHYISVPRYSKNISLKRIISHKIYSGKIVKVIDKVKPNLVYCLIPPNCLVKDIAVLKEKENFRLIYDVIDLWPESFPNSMGENLPFRMWKDLRDKYINTADKIVLECNYYKHIFNGIVPEHKINIIPIVKEKIGAVKEKNFNEDICLGYLGSINSLIDIERIVAIVRGLVREKTVLVRIVGDGNNKDHFINALRVAGANVEYYGKIFDDNKKKSILGACDFGLNIYKENIVVGLTLKSIDYFQLGLPILNSISGDTEKLVNKYQIGINSFELTQENIIRKHSEITVLKQNVSSMFDKEFSIHILDKRLRKVFDDNILK